MDLAQEEAERAENLLIHEDDIAARPARTWYVQHMVYRTTTQCSQFFVLSEGFEDYYEETNLIIGTFLC